LRQGNREKTKRYSKEPVYKYGFNLK
jgi:hypothetical protein